MHGSPLAETPGLVPNRGRRDVPPPRVLSLVVVVVVVEIYLKNSHVPELFDYDK